ncbi:GldG family protein [Spirulina subsalsa]|uniref:GldG family protein n=1 Tax=Spirulina subsalsa TaxID=54311 RepID=UPI0002F0F3FE|nr:Gldg family protein [Spirulina subsalsa]
MKNILDLAIFPKKYLKYLFWLGPFFAVAGLVAGFIGGAWSFFPIVFLVVGIAIIIIRVATLGGLLQSLLQMRSTQSQTNALVATLSVLIILGLINFLVGRYPLRVDLTETQLFTLSPQTQQLVQNLTQPMKVWVFSPQTHPTNQELLNRYRRLNETYFSYSLVDPRIEIGAAERFGVSSAGDVYLEYQEKQQLVQSLGREGILSEVQLTNAIEKILRDRPPKVYFLQGHGERPLEFAEFGLTQAVDTLTQQGYIVEPLNLATQGNIPNDATLVVIASPERRLFQAEVTALKAYLERPGSLMILLDPNREAGLGDLLSDWGLELDNRVIIDASGAGNVVNLGPATPIVTTYEPHPITLDFGQGISLYPFSAPILINEQEDVEATPIIQTSVESWAEQDIQSETLEFNPETDLEGPLNIGVALTRPVAQNNLNSEEEERTSEARLVVFGNSTFATNGWFNEQLNGDVFINSIKWLANEDDQILSIRPRELANRRLLLEPSQQIFITWLAIVIVPLGGFIGAGVIWWVRR